MAIPSFFKQNKPRGFNYVPRYYDPAKEELEQRRKAWSTDSSSAKAKEDGAESEEHGPSSAKATEGGSQGEEHGPSSAKATEDGSQGEEHGPSSAKATEDGSQGEEHGPSSAKATEGSASQPYRSKIMRGDMRNHFQRRKERVERHTTIRLLVIIIIIVLVVYLYLRF